MQPKPQITVIEIDAKLLMSPPEFAKLTGFPVNEIREKCKRGIYPHIVKHSKNCKPFIKILVPETLKIIQKECRKNAPLRPAESKNKDKPTMLAARVIAKILGGGK